MTTEQQEKAKWVSEIYAAVARGETIQVWHSDTEEWRDASNGPNLTCREDWWRIKPKPLRVWVWLNDSDGIVDATQYEANANKWKASGYRVIETVEVTP